MLHADIAASRVGTTLRDKWHLDRLIGVGGMAAVYAATHRNGSVAAIKVLHPECSAVPLMRERFLREGYLANLVAHAGTVKVLDDDEADDGSVYLVMHLLEGEALDRYATRKDRLPMGEVLRIVDHVLDVLVAAHAKGIIHRDLKPENLFLTPDGTVYVLDFGIAKERSESASSSDTEPGTAMGTPAFMPPEQARGRWDLVDGRSDLWALGATMFTLLSGRCVHFADTINETLLSAMTKPAPSLATVVPSAPASLVALVDRALQVDLRSRFPDAKSMQAALREVIAELGEHDREPASSIPAVSTSIRSETPTVPARMMTPSRDELAPPTAPEAAMDAAPPSRGSSPPSVAPPPRSQRPPFAAPLIAHDAGASSIQPPRPPVRRRDRRSLAAFGAAAAFAASLAFVAIPFRDAIDPSAIGAAMLVETSEPAPAEPPAVPIQDLPAAPDEQPSAPAPRPRLRSASLAGPVRRALTGATLAASPDADPAASSSSPRPAPPPPAPPLPTVPPSPTPGPTPSPTPPLTAPPPPEPVPPTVDDGSIFDRR